MARAQNCEMVRSNSCVPNRWHIIVLATCFILFQKGCVLTPDLSSAYISSDTPVYATVRASALVGEGEPFQLDIRQNAPLLSDSPRQTRRRASHLLRKAAAMIDRNDRTAIRLILQAINILKHEVLKGTNKSDYERVSSQRSGVQDPELLREAWTGSSWVEPCIEIRGQ